MLLKNVLTYLMTLDDLKLLFRIFGEFRGISQTRRQQQLNEWR